MEWWQELVVQTLAAAIGAGIAATVSFRIVRSEREARIQDREDHLSERSSDSDVRLRAVRGEAVGKLLARVLPIVDAGQPVLPDRRIELAIMRIVFDGTAESYDVYRWVYWKFQDASTLPLNPVRLSTAYEIVRVMLSGWLRPEDAGGAIASMRRQLDYEPLNGD